jgi:hypothetical protein
MVISRGYFGPSVRSHLWSFAHPGLWMAMPEDVSSVQTSREFDMGSHGMGQDLAERGQVAETTSCSWVKSSFSGNGDCCVEVAEVDDKILVRDSKAAGADASEGGMVLVFTRAEWGAFLRGVRLGEFDIPKEGLG